ncbi:MAG: fumarylacetoacetase [Phycisphaerales bacterium]|jgi:fumarylacetoacetase|nr:fumarylacetoacetase [Phycisphaerales bacterium]
MTNATHDPARQSWIESANELGCDFPIQNLPFGVFEGEDGAGRIGVAIGRQVLDVTAAIETGALALEGEAACALCAESLNDFMALGPDVWHRVRVAIGDLLDAESPRQDRLVRPMVETVMRLPADIGDYTDFYAARHHATNVGRMFRPDGEPLMPNWLHLPVGYHGRASSVVVSGTDIMRPHGQLKPDDGPPAFGPCRLLDYELEFGAFIGTGNPMGSRVAIGEASDRLFGVVILNDWSARDVQKWEYQPLGPFNAKNFASTISPWVVTMEALEPYRSHGPARAADDPPLLDYLTPTGASRDAIDVQAVVTLSSAAMRGAGTAPVQLSRGTLADLSWSFAQMLAHHTSTGCPMRPGDLIGSGTVSGPEKESRGCLLELTWRGTEPIDLPDGTQRRFLQDGDELTIAAWCEREGAGRVGFGTCSGVVLPAN